MMKHLNNLFLGKKALQLYNRGGMNKKILLSFIILCMYFPVVSIEYNPKNDFTGKWKIVDIFNLDAQYIDDIYDPGEAYNMMGEIITYNAGSYQLYHLKKNILFDGVYVNIYYDSEKLKKDTTGGWVKSYDFNDLKIPENIKEIRFVSLMVYERVFGSAFFVVDNNTLLFHWRGWIFKAIRQE